MKPYFKLRCSNVTICHIGIFVDSLRPSSFGVRKYFFTTNPTQHGLCLRVITGAGLTITCPTGQ